MNFTDFRSKFDSIELSENMSEDPVFLRRLMRGSKVSVGDKKVPVNVSKVIAGINIFNRTGKMQSIPPTVLPHYNAYISKRDKLANMFVTRAHQVEEVELNERKNDDPPPVIVLKRKGIRIFPDGKKVAVYVNTELNLDIAIPYDQTTGNNIPGVIVK